MSGKGLRMQAYYYSFDRTGVSPVDKVLSAVACAGKAFHHTDCWTDDDTHPDHEGGSPRDWIQNAANAVAAQLAFANADNARLRELLGAVRWSEYDGPQLMDVRGVNWWDAREAILAYAAKGGA